MAVLSDVTMQQAVDTLRARGVPLCFEQVPLSPERASRGVDGAIVYETARFSIALPDGPMPAALDALIAADPTCAWEQRGQRPTYAIYPRTSALDWTVAANDGGLDWIDALGRIGLEAHALSLFPRGLDRQVRYTVADDGDATRSARQWLTDTVDAVGQGRCWNLAGLRVAGSWSSARSRPQTDDPLTTVGPGPATNRPCPRRSPVTCWS